jgi:hypothetical protein
VPSQQLERYAEIARYSTRKVTHLPTAANDVFPSPAGTLDERICGLIPELRGDLQKPQLERPDEAMWAAAPTLLWWAVVLIVFTLAR